MQTSLLSSALLGSVVAWTNAVIPDGWLECNGQATTGYADLIALIGATVPDLRGEFVRGLDNGRGVDAGRVLRSSQDDEFKEHVHSIEVVGSGDNNSQWHRTGNYPPSASDTPTTTGASATELTGEAETRPRNVALIYIIKAYNVATLAKPNVALSEDLLLDGINYTAGVSNSVVITVADATPTQLWVTFDGVTQHSDQFAVVGQLVTFTEIIPLGVKSILIKNSKEVQLPALELVVSQKNYIINPTFLINQREFAGGAIPSGSYNFDRWRSGGNTLTVSLPDASGFITLGGTDTVGQYIEKFGVEGIVTISWDGTATGGIGGDGTGTVNTSPYVIDTTGLWTRGADSDALQVIFKEGTLKNVKLELGSTVTPFEYPDIGSELLKCQRYYWQGSGTGGLGYRASTGALSSMLAVTCSYPTTMRAIPTRAVITAPSYNNCADIVLTGFADGMEGRVQVGTSGRYRAQSGIYSADAEL